MRRWASHAPATRPRGVTLVSKYTLSHLSDPDLVRDLKGLVSKDHTTTAEMLAHLAEVDARKLYLPAAHPSMFSYCVHELGLSEETAFKRIRAARTARQFPAIFEAVADGLLHLSSVVVLASYLTPENADDLLEAASSQSKAGLEQLLAERFPRPDLPTRIEVLSPPLVAQLSPGTFEKETPGESLLASEPVKTSAPPPRLAPLSADKFGLQVTVGKRTHDKLRYAQSLLGHQVPSGDLAQVLDRALDALIHQLERQKFAATRSPRARARQGSSRARHIPAAVKRQVWERDGGQCTFKSGAGHRCPARSRLEFDHIEPVARGGRATADGMRLRCRAHNQYAAECAFGAGFMAEKREAARAQTAAREAAAKVIPYLRALGFRADEATHAAALCEGIPDASLEQRVKTALSYFAKGRTTPVKPAA